MDALARTLRQLLRVRTVKREGKAGVVCDRSWQPIRPRRYKRGLLTGFLAEVRDFSRAPSRRSYAGGCISK